MPDCDRFERRLDKKWRKAYRLARDNDDPREVVHLLRNALDDAQRKELACLVLDEVIALVHEAVNSPLFSPTDTFQLLSQKLDSLAISQLNSLGTRLATDVAKSTYAELIPSNDPITLKQVGRRISEKLSAQILDNQFFSPAREGIRTKNGRTHQEEREWEKRVTEEVILFKRTSRRWLSPQVWDNEQLHQSLPVLE